MKRLEKRAMREHKQPIEGNREKIGEQNYVDPKPPIICWLVELQKPDAQRRRCCGRINCHFDNGFFGNTFYLYTDILVVYEFQVHVNGRPNRWLFHVPIFSFLNNNKQTCVLGYHTPCCCSMTKWTQNWVRHHRPLSIRSKPHLDTNTIFDDFGKKIKMRCNLGALFFSDVFVFNNAIVIALIAPLTRNLFCCMCALLPKASLKIINF